MKILTCGCRLNSEFDGIKFKQEIIKQFDGIIADHFFYKKTDLEIQQLISEYEKTLIRRGFLYGNKHRKPDANSGCITIEEWVSKRIAEFPSVNEWVLVNEFLDNNFNPYPGYEYENLKSYFLAANQASPNAKLILSDFRPYQLGRWQKIKTIVERMLSENIPIHGVGIQVHFKTRNAVSFIPGIPYYLDALPIVIKMFDGVCPVHLNEVSLWHHYSEPPLKMQAAWEKLLTISLSLNVESFTPWWLVNPWDNGVFDSGKSKPMPSFEEFKGGGIYDKNWNQILRLPV